MEEKEQQDPKPAIMRRVYSAAIAAKKISSETPLTDLAALMNESPQRVKNWDTRGPSAQGLLMIQLVTGVNSSWALTDEGPMYVNEGATTMNGWPLSPELLAVLQNADETIRRRAENAARVALDMETLTMPSAGNTAA